MSLRILLGQVFFTGTPLRFSNDTLSHTGKIVQASTSLRNKSRSSTTDKVTTKGTPPRKAYRAVRSTVDKLKTNYPKKNVHCRKVTIVGSGRAALTSALALVATDTTKDVCMLSLNSSLQVQGEAMDIMHASVFIKDPKIVATKDHADTKGSDICVIAAGTEQGPNEDNYEFTSRNSRLIHEVIPELMRYSPEAVYLVAGDPVDVLTREAWLAGGMNQSRIIGTGTNLYSAMLRSLISNRLGVHAASCHGLVLGQNNPCSNPCANSGGDGGHSLCRAAWRLGVRPSHGTRRNLHYRLYCATVGSGLAIETSSKLFQNMSTRRDDTMRKVTVVGAGQVGMAVVFGMLAKRITNHVALVDAQPEKLKAEYLDLMHASVFLNDPIISASTDYSMSAGSSICVVTAGVRQKVGESRLDLAQRNIDILKTMIPQLVKYSPDTILLLASNPVDILTYASWKISKLPMSRVIGSGCMVDSARYRYLLAEKLGVAPAAVNAYIIGEHGDSSVPIWSGVNVGGVRLAELNPKIGTECDAENFKSIHKEVIQSAYTIIKAKGYTSWAIGLCLAQICEKILFNSNSVLPVSTSMKGHYGIGTDVFLSMPCVLGRGGITDVIKVPLNKSEQDSLVRSAALMDKAQNGIKF